MSTSGRRPITVAAVIALSSATGAGVVVASFYHHHRAALLPIASAIGPSSIGSSEASASAAPLAELESARPVASSPPPPPRTRSASKTNAVSWPADTDKDALDAAAITPVVKTAYPALDQCRVAALGRNPNLQGKTKTQLLIERDGHVSAVRDGGSDVPDSVARKCVEDALAKLVFPAANGRTVAIIPVKLALR